MKIADIRKFEPCYDPSKWEADEAAYWAAYRAAHSAAGRAADSAADWAAYRVFIKKLIELIQIKEGGK